MTIPSPLIQFATRHERLLVTGTLAGGVGLRLAWLAFRPGGLLPSTAEPEGVAVSLVTSGQFADAFRAGSGATAHLSPLMPWVIASVYRLFGIATPAAEVVLSALAIGLIAASFYFIYRAMTLLGSPILARLGALFVVALVPMQLPLEAKELKVWEAPLCLALVSAVLAYCIYLHALPKVKWRDTVPIMPVVAILFVASPVASIVLLAILVVLTVSRVEPRRWLATVVLVSILTGALVAPWIIRNQQVMHRTIVTRSNGNLELALAYSDTLLNGADRKAAYLARLNEIHPMPLGGGGYAAMRAAGGEVAYYDRLGVDARHWMSSHPEGTLRLLARHVGQYIVPPEWFFATWPATGEAHAAGLRRWLLAVPALISLLAWPFLIRADRRYLYLLIAVVLLMLPYIVVQPILRYRYLNSTLFMFVAFDVLGRMWRRYAVRRVRQDHGTADPEAR